MKYGRWMMCLLLLAGARGLTQTKINLPAIADTIVHNGFPPPADTIPAVKNEEHPFRIREIYISGNQKTKPYIIERELPFSREDYVNLPQLVKKFEIAREQLMNTALFHEVVVALKSFDGYDIDILIDVKERWYVFPIPYFKLVDRNLNQWWVEQKRDLDRVNYGIKFTHSNFTGRKDKLKAWLINGYNRQVQVRYEHPYADKALKHGYNVGFTYIANREINFATIDDKQAFIKQDKFIRHQMQVNLEYVYRPALRTRHTFKLIYTDEMVADTVLKLNSNYFNNNLKRIRFPEFSYTMDYQFVDYIPYPQHGFMGDFTLLKQGVNKQLNLWQLNVRGSFSRKITPKMSYTVQLNGMLRLPFNQPYYAQKILGYNDNYLRGLEYYVIDGVAGAIIRPTLRREMFKISINNPVRSNINKIPFRFFLKTYTDLGYVYSRTPEQNMLPNKLLTTTGIGIDVITIYDFVLRFEYSFNTLGQNGLFIHNRNDL